MRTIQRTIVFVALAALAVVPRLRAQTAEPAQFDCSKEAEPLSSYCRDINQFLADAAKSKRAAGKVDRSDLTIKSDLRSFWTVYSDPTRFSALLANSAAATNTAISIFDSLPTTSGQLTSIQNTISGVTQNRPDQQTGAGSSASGTTTLVEKAGTAAVLAFALESGALTRSVNGNTATLSGNADGLVRTLTGRQALCFDCKDSGAFGTKVLRDVNLSAAFLIDQQSASTVATSGPANSVTPPEVTLVNVPTKTGKLSSFTARYQFWNPYDPHSAAFLKTWKQVVADAKTDIDKQSKDLQGTLIGLINGKKLDQDAKFQAELSAYADTFYDDADSGDLNKFRKDFVDLFNDTVDAWKRDDPDFNQKIATVNLSLAQYRTLWSQLLDKAKGQPLLTFEYSFNRPANQPETHDFRLVYGYVPKSPAIGMLSLNAAISLYGGAIPAGAKYGRLHDGQISAEYDRPITIKDNPNQAVFSLAAYWQYQPDPSVLNITAGDLAPGTNIELPNNAQVLLGTAGSLWVTQAKVVINAKSGIKIPIAVKWANKTDLLSGNKLGAQVGISYDFSSLSSLFGSSN